MSLETRREFSLKKAANGDLVPVVDGVHLHSIYDPQKEAENLLVANSELLKKKSNVLVLGLGMGHHVEKIANFLQTHHRTYNLVVLEPNSKTVEAYEEIKAGTKASFTIKGTDVDQLFTDRDFTLFLASRPGVITHPPSFNLYQKEFKGVLSYRFVDDFSHFNPFSQRPRLKALEKYAKNYLKMSDLIASARPGKSEMAENYFFLALKEISKFGTKKDL